MTEQTFVNSSKFSRPVKNLKAEIRRNRVGLRSRPSKYIALTNMFATFCVTSRVHEQVFVCDSFHLSNIKANRS